MCADVIVHLKNEGLRYGINLKWKCCVYHVNNKNSASMKHQGHSGHRKVNCDLIRIRTYGSKTIGSIMDLQFWWQPFFFPKCVIGRKHTWSSYVFFHIAFIHWIILTPSTLNYVQPHTDSQTCHTWRHCHNRPVSPKISPAVDAIASRASNVHTEYAVTNLNLTE